jgi:hypothetical protein
MSLVLDNKVAKAIMLLDLWENGEVWDVGMKRVGGGKRGVEVEISDCGWIGRLRDAIFRAC